MLQSQIFEKRKIKLELPKIQTIKATKESKESKESKKIKR
jgi:hypothetical protein